jgi:hypothetical protein
LTAEPNPGGGGGFGRGAGFGGGAGGFGIDIEGCVAYVHLPLRYNKASSMLIFDVSKVNSGFKWNSGETLR